MSVQSEKVKRIGHRVAMLRRRRLSGLPRWRRSLEEGRRWMWMLYHEYLLDEVKIRAQSLAFLMIFSLLPLIAGAFFIFTFLAQFGMVQDAISKMVVDFLGTIPPVHREFINDYILRFKDAYLANITHKSGNVGIFALLILGWIGLQVFNNIDTTLNFIWSSERTRPFYEKLRNFIVVSVVGPIVFVGAFSVPLILHRQPATRFFFQSFPVLNVLLNYVIPFALVFGLFLLLYRFVPVCRVWWKSAFWGATFATVSLGIANGLMRVYFAFGTNSAYGKAAGVPLIGFWIFLLWIVVIMGAEVSYLIQNQKDLFIEGDWDPTLKDGQGLLAILAELFHAYKKGSGPQTFEALRDAAHLGSGSTRALLRYLQRSRLILECAAEEDEQTTRYGLAKDVSQVSIPQLLKDFYHPAEDIQGSLEKLWVRSLERWFASFEDTQIADLAK